VSDVPSRGLFVVVCAALLAGCPEKPKPNPDPAVDAGASALSVDGALPSPEHGKELMLAFQCNRCHDGTGHPAAEQKKHCVHCHKDIMEDRFQAAAVSIAKWKPRVRELADAPSLEATNKRFTRRWVEAYLQKPTDLRPNLHQYMPRLAITPPDARDLAAYLVPDADGAGGLGELTKLDAGDLGRGRQLLDTKGCGSCHAFTGVAAPANSAPPPMDGKELERARRLAPDLRFTRDRTTSDKLVTWLADPKAVKPDTAMPRVLLSRQETIDLAAYLMKVELSEPRPRPPVTRLPVLGRKVTFKEVDEKVFHRTCWHCHSEPDYAIGDGGPGNSGGFGFKPRGLNLSDYNGITAGFIDDKGERESIFGLGADDKIPRVVRALLARYEEEAGAETGRVRGMPLGYDALSLEDIQLVESWVAQGRPR
jgi:mono/diheme cytochrome c family protein